MKNDRYRRVRGGKAAELELHCVSCGAPVMRYQKDGDGRLLRCYLNRIISPPELEQLHRQPVFRQPHDLLPLTCTRCRVVIGTPMRHADGRLAFRLRIGFFTKTRCK